GLLQAAKRGVRVRILLDDLTLKESDVDFLLSLSLHPNLSVRIYNPVETVGVNFAEFLSHLLFSFKKYNQRLHNKTMVMDGTLGVTGGRNVSNSYFWMDTEHNYLDRGVLVLGPVALQMQENFEIFWNHPLSRPIEGLLSGELDRFPMHRLNAFYAELIEYNRLVTAREPMLKKAWEEELRKMVRSMRWLRAEFISDPPYKNPDIGIDPQGYTTKVLTSMIEQARETIMIQSPYFILPERGLPLFDKRGQGIEVIVSTNSLSSTDNVAVFSAYAEQRSLFLDAGFVLREMKPHPAFLRPEHPQKMVLHGKTIIIDSRDVFIGTFNIDPRSSHFNTEEGILFEDPVLARKLEKRIRMIMEPENSWNPEETDPDEKAGCWRRMRMQFFQMLPIRPLL
ncbi:MAG: phospholipase D-like domain-containing protein, partial [Desulfovibrionales bacterium]